MTEPFGPWHVRPIRHMPGYGPRILALLTRFIRSDRVQDRIDQALIRLICKRPPPRTGRRR